jgi:hypothetical protein
MPIPNVCNGWKADATAFQQRAPSQHGTIEVNLGAGEDEDMRRIFAAGLFAFSIAVAADTDGQDLPLVAKGSDGPCRMTVSGGGHYFSIQVTGLKPGEQLAVTSASEGEVMNMTATAERDGSYSAIDIPLVQGKTSGTGTFTVEGSRCKVHASYPWRE